MPLTANRWYYGEKEMRLIMKRLYRIYCFVFILISVSFGGTSCKNGECPPPSTAVFWQEFIADDTTALTDRLTTAYDLQALKTFFDGHSDNEFLGFQQQSDYTSLTIRAVQQRFTIEILRTRGYTVYAVKEGGYFYVFWIQPVKDSTETSQSAGMPTVYFAAYMPSSQSARAFDVLQPGISTATDVAALDPAFELSFLLSSGTFSYSYLNVNKVLEIEYIRTADIQNRNDLIVKSKRVLSRDIAPSHWAAVLAKDLPPAV